MLVLIRGAGDLASGIALRLHHAGLRLVLLDLEKPTAIRRTVCFSQALIFGRWQVEDVCAVRAETPEDVEAAWAAGEIPVLADPDCRCLSWLRPDALVDAILAKRNLGTRISDAPVVIGVGPGFTAGEDCHAVVETMRGHTLGRVILSGSAIPNTGVPGNIGGFTIERVMHSENAGTFHALREIGDTVTALEPVAEIGGVPLRAKITGTLRGLLPEGFYVPCAGFKSGDVDPRCELSHCYTASDKALAVGGGVLEAVLTLTGALK